LKFSIAIFQFSIPPCPPALPTDIYLHAFQ
jgi:hypothetical protein